MTTDETEPVVGEWVPAFPGQRPPFQPGNDLVFKPGHELSTTHGAYSPRKVEPVAQELLDAVLTDEAVRYLHLPAYRPALVAWAQAEARVILIEQWVSGMSMAKAAASTRGATSPLELLRKWEATASTHRARLGLDPLSRARLGKDMSSMAVDAAKILSAERSAAADEAEEASDGE